MKPRLLYVITLAEMGGAQNHVLELVRCFRDTYTVAVAVGTDGYLGNELSKLGVDCHVLPDMRRSINPWADIKAIAALRRLMVTLRPDIVHSHSTKAGLLTRIAARLAGVRSVHSIHGWAFDSGVPFRRKAIVWPIEAIAALFSDRLLTPTRYDRDFGVRRLPVSGRRFSIIPYGIRPNAPQSTPGRPNPPVRIIMPARFSEQKDQETLIRACGQIAHLNFQIDLVGDGPFRAACETLALALGLGDKVRFLGTRHDLDDLLAEQHIFVLCTHYEGLPLSIMEAMRAGLPVIATDVSGVREEVDHGTTGFLVPHNGVTGTANHLATLIGDAEIRARFGTAGRRKFETEFTDQVMVSRMGKLYQDMINREF